MLICEKITNENRVRSSEGEKQRSLSSDASLPAEARTTAQKTASLLKLFLDRLDNPVCAAEDANEAGKAAVYAAMSLGELLSSTQSPEIGETTLNAPFPATSPMSTIKPLGVSLTSSLAPSHSPLLPDLPPIRDESLSELPFRHAGTLTTQEVTLGNASYERLEFLGDAYLEVIASRLIYTYFPHLSAGRMSQVREALVKNETLAEYAVAYGFDKRAQVPHSHQRPGKLGVKTLGDIFEAYVAAVVLADPQNGFKTAEAWLTDLWKPKLLEQTKQPKPNIHAKQSLAKRIMGKNIKVSYVDEGEPETCQSDGKTYYHISAYLSGWGWKNQLLGSGRGLNKVEAGNQAAAMALANTPLIDQIAAVKQAHDAKVKEQRAREGVMENISTS